MAIRTKTTGFKQDGLAGGWVTAVPHTALEPNQSPNMMNMVIDSDGNVRKREGVLDLGKVLGINSGYMSTLIPISCAGGTFIMLAISATSITVYAYNPNDTTGQPWVTTTTYSNVFSNKIQNKRLNYTVIQEQYYTKVILTSSRHVPIQITIASGSGTAVKANGTNTLWNGVLQMPPNVYNSVYTDFTMWVNGAVNTLSSFSAGAFYSAATFNTSSSYANGTYTIQWACVSWQWWAEAIKLDKSQITNSQIQGTSTQHVPVPQEVLYDIDQYSLGRFPLAVYSSTAYDAKFTYTNPPTTTSQYAFSTGAGGTSGTTLLPPSPDWVTFGVAPGTPRPVLFTRGFKLPFQGGKGLHVYNNGLAQNNHAVISYYTPYFWDRYLVVPPSEGGAGVGHATSQAYYLRKRDYTVSTSNTALNYEGVYISFDGSGTASGALSYTGGGDIIMVIDTCSKVMSDNLWLGTGASGTGTYNISTNHVFNLAWSNNEPLGYINQSGLCIPIFGISDYCNYALGYFPDVVSTFQRRVVLGGMPHNPMQVVFSNIEDSHSVPGLYCNNFQTTLEFEYDSTCAFDITLPSYADDTIIAMKEFADSLFVWTKYKLFRIYAGDNSVLGFDTVKYATVAEIGCVNGMSALIAGNTPTFISSDGVYGVFPDNTASGYSVKELSIKVRDFFLGNNTNITQVAMLMYDSARKELYVNTSCGQTLYGGELLVYNTLYECWTRIALFGQKNSYMQSGCVVYKDLVNPDVIIGASSQRATGNINLFKLHHTENVDVLYRTLYGGAGSITVPFTNSSVTWTTVNGQLEYTFPNYYAVSSVISSGLRLSPVLSYEDCIVTLGGVRKTFGTDYVKTPTGIRLTSNPGAGVSLVCYPGFSYNGTVYPPLVCIQAGVMHFPNEFTTSVDGTLITFNGSWTPTSTLIDVCSIYGAWVSSPGLTLDTLKTKNAAHYIGYFDNRNTLVTNQKFNVNMAVLYDDNYSGITTEELYGDYETLASTTDMYGKQQYKQYTRVAVPLLGSGYVMNAYHYVNSPCTFKLIGYELQVPQTNRQLYSDEET